MSTASRTHHDCPPDLFPRRRTTASSATRQPHVVIPPRLGRDRARFCLASALIIVPLYLAGVYVLVGATHLRYLLYPSLAAIGYDLFIRDPQSWATTLRNAVLGPVLGAAIGVAALAIVPAGPLQVLVVALVAMVALRLANVVLAPALAVALLTLLAGGESLAYLLSIAASAVTIAVIFRLWRDLLYEPRFGPAEPELPSQG